MKLRSILLLSIVTIFASAGFGQLRAMPASYSIGANGPVPRSVGSVTPAVVRSLERDTFQLINTERALAGLGPLKWSDKVADVARLHSENMAEYDFFSHKGLDGLMVDERAEKMNMGPWKAIGENIAFMKGHDDAVHMAVDMWLKSPGHKKNLLSPEWTETAIGLAVTNDGKYYFTQVFIKN